MSKPIKIVPELIDPSGYEAIDAAVTALEALKKATSAFGRQVAGIEKFSSSLATLKQVAKDLGDETKNTNLFDAKAVQIIVQTEGSVKGLTRAYNENKQAVEGQRKVVELATNSVTGYEKTLKTLIANYKAVDLSTADAGKQQAQFLTQIKSVRGMIEEQTVSLRKNTGTLQAAQGSYNALSAELNELRKQLRAMPEGMNENSAAAFAMKKRVAELDEQLKKFDRELGQNFREVGSYARGIIEAKEALERKKAALQQQSTALMVYGKNLQKGSAEHNKLQTELNQTERELKQVNIQLNAFQQNNSQVNNTINKMGIGLKGMVAGLIGLSVLDTLRQTGIDAFDTGRKFESLRLSIDFASGSAAEGAKNFEFLREISQRLGMDLLGGANGFKQILAAGRQAGLESKEIRRIFESVATAATAMGLNTHEQEGIFLAFSQILSKGKVQAEELRGQIGERLPGAFNIAARAMNVTTQELNKMLEDGKVISNEFLPKFATELQNTFEGALPKAMESTTSNLGRLKTAWQEALDSISQSNNSFINGTLKLATRFAKGLKNIFSDPVKDATQEALAQVSVFEENMVSSLKSLAEKTQKEGGNVDSAIRGQIINVRATLIDDLKKAQADLDEVNAKINNIPAGLRAFGLPKALTTSLAETTARVALLKGELDSLQGIADKVRKAEADAIANELGQLEKLRKEREELIKKREQEKELSSEEVVWYAKRIEWYDEEIKRLTTLQKLKEQVSLIPVAKNAFDQKEADELTELDFKREEKRFNDLAELRRKALIEESINHEATKENKDKLDREIEMNEVAHLLTLLSLYKQYGKDTTDLEEELLKKRLDKWRNTEEEITKLTKEEVLDRAAFALEQASVFGNAAFDVASGLRERDLQDLEAKKQAELTKLEETANESMRISSQDKEVQAKLRDDYEKAREQKEEQFRKREAAIKTRQAKADKAQTLFNIALNTGMAVTSVLSTGGGTRYADFGISAGILTALVIAQGLAQAAAVIAKPIPQFFRGTSYAPEGLAFVDERGPEIIERKGKMYLGQDEGPRLTYLKRGDKVYTAEKTRNILAEAEAAQAMESFEAGSRQLRKAEHSKNVYMASLRVAKDPETADYLKKLVKATENRPEFHSLITKDGFEMMVKKAGNITRYRDNIFPNGKLG